MVRPQFQVHSIIPPSIEPVTLSETKDFIRIDDASNDGFISNLISVARQAAETFLKRSLITQTLRMEFDQYAPSTFELVLGPVQSITRATLVNRDLSETSIDSSMYYLTVGKDNIVFDVTPVSHKVLVEYVVGYGDNAEDVPHPIRQAMHIHIARMYDNRTGNSSIPNASRNLYMPYRVINA